MGLSFAEKANFIFTKKIDFPKIRCKNVQYFNLGHTHSQNLAFISALIAALAINIIISLFLRSIRRFFVEVN